MTRSGSPLRALASVFDKWHPVCASLLVSSRAGGLSSHGSVPFIPFILPLSLIFLLGISASVCLGLGVGVRSPGGRVQKHTAVVLDNRRYYSEHPWDASPFGFPAPTDSFAAKAFVCASVFRAPEKYCKLALCQRRVAAGKNGSRPQSPA